MLKIASKKRVELIKKYVIPKYKIDLELGRVLKISSNEPIESFHKKAGYYTVTVRIEGKSVSFFQHEVIAVYIGLDIEGKTVNHIDGDKKNNKPNNLEAVTRGDNVRLHWLGKGRSRKVTEAQRIEMRRLRKEGKSYPQIAAMFDVSHTTVQWVIKGRTDRFNGKQL